MVWALNLSKHKRKRTGQTWFGATHSLKLFISCTSGLQNQQDCFSHIQSCCNITKLIHRWSFILNSLKAWKVTSAHLYHNYNLFEMLTVVRIFKSIYVHLVKIILCSIKLNFIVTCPYNMSAAAKPPITSLWLVINSTCPTIIKFLLKCLISSVYL